MLCERYPPNLHVAAEKARLHCTIRSNHGNRISLTNVGKVALYFASFSREGEGQKPQYLNHGAKLVAPSVQPGCNPTSTIISLEVVAPTCIRTRCTWSRAIVRGISFGGIHVARELRSRCAADRTKKTVERQFAIFVTVFRFVSAKLGERNLVEMHSVCTPQFLLPQMEAASQKNE